MTVSVAVLGAGYFAALHHDGWARLPGARLVAVADRDRDRAERAAHPHRARAFADVEAMLARARPDVLDICVPPDGHAEAIRAGLAADVSMIVCQKPFCRDADEARAVAAEARTAGIPLAVHENFRFQPWWRAIRAAVAEGAVGDPLDASFRLRPGDGQGADAYADRQPYFRTMPRLLVHETGVHFVDVFRFLLGEAEAVTARTRRLNPAIRGEDAAIVVTEHGGGAQSVFDGNRLLDHDAADRRRTMGEGLVEGTGGTLLVDGSGAVTLRRAGSRATRTVLAAEDHARFGGDCVHHLQAHLLRHLAGRGPLENGAEDYLPVLATEAAIYRSAAEGRRVALGPFRGAAAAAE